VASREERIRQRAYEIWERAGRPHGRDQEHWRQAEAEIDTLQRAAAPRTGRVGRQKAAAAAAGAAPAANERAGGSEGGEAPMTHAPRTGRVGTQKAAGMSGGGRKGAKRSQ
jgi:Protein of unknown function (DUF2934)